ncbi:hypothetical protein Tco_1110437 [Tanacetum coccineum]|uniref:Uncharacterized protein n=1 Tax=Tanacetum coccineum TaxID=301880 RepID=A0ABQ5IIU4_9ASTR
MLVINVPANLCFYKHAVPSVPYGVSERERTFLLQPFGGTLVGGVGVWVGGRGGGRGLGSGGGSKPFPASAVRILWDGLQRWLLTYKGNGGDHHFFHGLWDMFIKAFCQFRVVNPMHESGDPHALRGSLHASGSLKYFFCCMKYAKKAALRSFIPPVLSLGNFLRDPPGFPRFYYRSSVGTAKASSSVGGPACQGGSFHVENVLEFGPVRVSKFVVLGNQSRMDFLSLVTANFVIMGMTDSSVVLFTEILDVNPGKSALSRIFRVVYSLVAGFCDSGHKWGCVSHYAHFSKSNS